MGGRHGGLGGDEPEAFAAAGEEAEGLALGSFDLEALVFADAAATAQEQFHPPILDGTDVEGLDAGAGFAPQGEAGGQNAGVVEDEEVAGAQELGQFDEAMIFGAAGLAVEAQEAALLAGGGRLLGDGIGGKLVIEKRSVHNNFPEKKEEAKPSGKRHFTAAVANGASALHNFKRKSNYGAGGGSCWRAADQFRQASRACSLWARSAGGR